VGMARIELTASTMST